VNHLVFIDSNFSGIEGLRRARELGHRFSAVMCEGFIPYPMNDATRRVLASAERVLWIDRTTDPTQLAGALRRILAERPIDAVISHHEHCVEPLSQVCVELGLRYTNVEAVRLARNKHLARERLRSAGVPSARFAFARTLDDAVAAFARSAPRRSSSPRAAATAGSRRWSTTRRACGARWPRRSTASRSCPSRCRSSSAAAS
jgi:hypothetical protein